MNQKILVVVAMSAFMFLTGCSTLEKASAEIGEKIGGSGRTSDYPKVSNTVKQGCLGGFAAGVVTALVKQKLLEGKKINKIEVLRDGLIGTILGCTIAEGLDRRRKNFSNDADHFDAEILDARQQNDQTKKLVAHTRTLTAESRTALEKLQADKAGKTLVKEEVAKARSNAAADLRWAKKELEVVEGNLEQRQGASELMETSGESGRAGQMESEIAELQNYVNSLEQEVASLASINDAIGQLDA